MATIKEKLRLETEKSPNEIILHREGIFYIAYEHSAWLFVTLVQGFKVKKRFVKNVGAEVASIGFPMTSLKNLVGERACVEEDCVARVEIPASEMPATDGFETWKGSLPLCVASNVATDDVQNVLQPAGGKEQEIITRLRVFPIESRSPMECMLFLIELKGLLQDGYIHRT